MARRHDVSEEDSPGRLSLRGKRRMKRHHAIGLIGSLAAILGVAVLPAIATSRAVLVPILDRYAGIAPLRVDFQRVSAGWFAPVGVEGLRLIDAQGNAVIKVGTVQTEKGLLSWITSSQNLGTVQVRDLEVDVSVAQGTSSIEQALQPLMEEDDSEDADDSSSSHMVGALELVNAHITLRDAQHTDAWTVTIPRFKTQLPGPDQIIGPTELTASVSDAAGTASGSIAADVAESLAGDVRTFNVRAAIDHVPLAFWHIVHERLPEIPIDELSGSITARIAGSLVDGERWSFNIEQLSGDQLVVTAPTLVGAKPAHLQSLRLQGQASLAQGSLDLGNTQLITDFGGITASGRLPWPIATPTLTEPWLPGAQLNAEGSIDLARLVKVAETLVPMRQDTRLVSGSATFHASQQLNANGQPSSVLDVQLGDLVAVANGQQLTWDQPLKLAVRAQAQADGQVALSGTCSAEFCQVTAAGSSTDGSFKGEVNLDRLQQRLAQWVELPLSTMTGTANIDMHWSQTQPGLIAAEGQLATTPLVIAIAGGGELREPAWKGTFSAQGRLRNTQLATIERAHVEVVAAADRLKLDLLEPLHLLENGVPAAFTLSSEGALDLWQKRAVMLKLLDPSMTLAGNYTLGASGRIDASHLELLQANWRSQPFEVGSGQSHLVEPEMVGNFEGRIDTSDLTRLAIEKLAVQAHSFSLSAADSAGADNRRSGTGAFIVDLAQLMRNVHSSAPSTPAGGLVLPPGAGTPAASPESQLAFSGQINGNLRWQVNSQAASFELDAKTNQIDIIQQLAGEQPQRLWSEPELVAEMKGAWDAATGNTKIESMQLKAPWMHYAGTMQIESGEGEQTIRANGQCLYDAAMVATKLQPYIGNNVQLVGRKTVPVEVELKTGGPATATSTLAGLRAATRIGWEQARVVGIDVGMADVPVNVTAGQLATRAEIPVSGGILRWDMQSDLTAPQTVLMQKPMKVLENVAITPQMCQSWLKYVAPLLAEATAVDGRLSLELTEARFNVANPRDQIVDGKLIIHSAAVGPGPLANQLIGLVQQVNAIRKKELATAVSTQKTWVQMPEQAIAFRMENGRVMHRDLRFKVGDAQLLSSGTVDIDGRIDLNTQMPIPDDWAAKSPLLSGLRGQSLQFPVRGTLTAPQLDAQSLKDFGRQAVTQAAEGLLQQQLSRGLGKLFGTPPAAAGTTPPVASPPLSPPPGTIP